jgi:hypothetical protein
MRSVSINGSVFNSTIISGKGNKVSTDFFWTIIEDPKRYILRHSGFTAIVTPPTYQDVVADDRYVEFIVTDKWNIVSVKGEALTSDLAKRMCELFLEWIL